MILAGKIDRDACWYDKDWHCIDGDKKYPVFVCDTKGRYINGEVDNTLQASLTNHGFAYLREFLINIQMQMKIKVDYFNR
ncbi:MAG: hypothetical protein ACRCZ0_11875 [Cetobacterium sp.]